MNWRQIVFWGIFAMLIASVAGVTATPRSLQDWVDATPTGGVLRLPAGTYQGPVSIARSMEIDGGHQAVIEGAGRGTVIHVEGQGVTLRGLHVRGSGDSHDGVDAGLLLQGEGHRIEDNQFDDVLFGLHLKQVSHSKIRNNRVRGKDLPMRLRGDALRVWYSRDNLVETNQFERARDITFANAPGNEVVNNRFVDGRYGLHLVFSPKLQIVGNQLSRTGTGIVVLYSPDVVVQGNRVEHALTDGGAGVVSKESPGMRVEGNQILHCAVGLKADAAVNVSGALVVRSNHFAHNIIGLYLYGEAGGHLFEANRFDNNLTTVATSAPGVASADMWKDNAWDDYMGFDRDHDGVGDTPHEVFLFADRIWMEAPMTTFFRNSPAMELLDFLERLAPFSSPHRLLADPSPRMQ